MASKACKKCKAIVESGSRCPICGSEELTDSSKGRLIIVKPDESEVAKNVKITKKGTYAVKLG
jgi:DNA-directed RNA polymerase subunit E"